MKIDLWPLWIAKVEEGTSERFGGITSEGEAYMESETTPTFYNAKMKVAVFHDLLHEDDPPAELELVTRVAVEDEAEPHAHISRRAKQQMIADLGAVAEKLRSSLDHD